MNDSLLKPQMNTIHHKAYILQTLNYSLTDSLMAVAIIHFVVATTYHKGQMISLMSKPQKKYDVGIHKRTW